MSRDSLLTESPFPRNYASKLLKIVSGRGVYVKDAGGKRYLDFGSGIAVNALGYGLDGLARRLRRQVKKLIHISNLFANEPAVDLARSLLTLSVAGSEKRFTAVHFGNSGAEGNEAAIKYARLYAMAKRGPGHHKILSFSNAFHGRTIGALSVTPNEKYRKKFEPLMPGCETAAYNDPDSARAVIDGSFAAVIVEPVQGEGGLTVMSEEFASALNEACARHDVILIADEIQTGLGRTGELFGSGYVGLDPDIITLSKPLAAGLPLSATLIPEKVNRHVETGDHGTTFGGGPVTAEAGRYMLERITAPGFLERVRRSSAHLDLRLRELAAELPAVAGLRGAGLLRGLEILAPEARPGGRPGGDHAGGDQAGGGRRTEAGGAARMGAIIAAAEERGVLVLRSGSNILRIAPPLIIKEHEIDRGVEILRSVLSKE
ncbi:MAG: aspartate aminotransferase family protein [Alkalispirochaetaceae bacterium]